MKKGVIIVSFIVIIFSGIILFYAITDKTKEYNLSEKFGIHGNVINYGTYYDEKDVTKLFATFEKTFEENLKNGKKTYFIYGNEEGVMVSTYEQVFGGTIGLNVGEKLQTFKLKENKYSLSTYVPIENKVTVIIDGKSYDFKLEGNENLYFIVSEELN
jgi:hypothetical protein